jgi:flagellar hook-length control protein FliK
MKAMPVIQTAVRTGGIPSSAGIATGPGNAEASAGSSSAFAGALKAAGTKPGRRSGVAKQPDDGASGGNLPPTGNPPPPIAMTPAAGGLGSLHRPVDSGAPEAIGVGRSGAQSAASADRPSTVPGGVGGTGALAGFTGTTATTATTATIATTASIATTTTTMTTAALDGSAAIDGTPAAGAAADAAGNAGTAGAAGEPLSTFAWAASGVSAETLSAATVTDGSMPLGRSAVAAATRGTTPAKGTLAKSSTPAQGSVGNSTISALSAPSAPSAPSASSGAIASDNGRSGLSAPIAAAVPNDLTAGDAAGVAASVVDMAGAPWSFNSAKASGENAVDSEVPNGAVHGASGAGGEAAYDAFANAPLVDRRSESLLGARTAGGTSALGTLNTSKAPIGIDGIEGLDGVAPAKPGHAGSDLTAPTAGGDPAAGLAQLNANAAPATAASDPVLRVHATVGSDEFAQGLSDRVSWMVDNGVNGAKLQVNPPQLGPIELRIAVQGDHAQVWMSTHSAVARDALESHSPRLREMLNDQGFSQVSVDISQRSFQERPAHAQPYQPEPVDERSKPVKPVAAARTAAAMPRTGLAGLDAYA